MEGYPGTTCFRGGTGKIAELCCFFYRYIVYLIAAKVNLDSSPANGNGTPKRILRKVNEQLFMLLIRWASVFPADIELRKKLHQITFCVEEKA
jgi:hypothetical protein